MKTYTYYLNQRPAGPGAVPKGSFILNPDDEGGRYGSITYESPLSEKDIAAFELTPAFKKEELNLTNMNFDLLVDREFNKEEHFLSPGPFCIIDGEGNEKNFDFNDSFIDKDNKNPYIVHVDLWNLDISSSDKINRDTLQNAIFTKFNICTGETHASEIKPRKVENLKFSFGNNRLESFYKLDLSLHKSLTYSKGKKVVRVAEDIEQMAIDNIRELAKAGGRSEQLRCYADMKADPQNSFVSELCHKDKLTTREIDKLAGFFGQASDFLFVKGAGPEENNRLLVTEMKNYGLNNSRIKLIIDSSYPLKEQFSKSGVALALKQAEKDKKILQFKETKH